MGLFSQKYTIRVNRDSVNMGDDMSSHAREMNVNGSFMLSSFLSELTRYVPAMSNVIWAIKSNTGTCGYIITDGHANAKVKLSISDMELKNTGINTIYCKYYYPAMYGENDPDAFLEKVTWDSET